MCRVRHDAGGVAFIGARTRDCCKPGGVFFAVNTKTSYFGLFASLEDAASFYLTNALATGAYNGVGAQWHTLKLQVLGQSAAGWLDGTQVFADVTLPSTISNSGWVTIGTGSWLAVAGFAACGW
jgi:hypothetical protein